MTRGHCRLMALLLRVAIAAFAASCAPARTPATSAPEDTATHRPTTTPSPFFEPTHQATVAAAPTPEQQPAASCPKPAEGVLSAEFDDENMADRVLAYLNAGGQPSALQKALNARQIEIGSELYSVVAELHQVDLTGDDLAEVVIEAKVPASAYSHGILLVYSCGPGVYELKFHYDNPFTSNDLAILAIEDLNGDRLPEIIYFWADLGATGGSYPENYYVLGWDGATFVQMVESEETPDRSGPAAVVYDSFPQQSHLEDLDADGFPELMLRSGPPGGLSSCDAGPVREKWWVWAWDGEAVALDRVLPDPPLYRFQAVQDGDRLTSEGRLEEALAAYQAAIFDEGLEPGTGHYWVPRMHSYCIGALSVPPADLEERPRLEAYSRYRLVLIHVAREDLATAAVVYDTLQSEFPSWRVGHAYAEMARLFWEQLQTAADPHRACAAAIEYARDHKEVIFSYQDWDYGWANPAPEPEETCPLPLGGAQP